MEFAASRLPGRKTQLITQAACISLCVTMVVCTLTGKQMSSKLLFLWASQQDD